MLDLREQRLSAEISVGGASVSASCTLGDILGLWERLQARASKSREKDSHIRVHIECPDCHAGPVFLTTRKIKGVVQQCCRRCEGRFPVEGL